MSSAIDIPVVILSAQQMLGRGSAAWAVGAGAVLLATACGGQPPPASAGPAAGQTSSEAPASRAAAGPATARPSLAERCSTLCDRQRACGATGAEHCVDDCRRRHEAVHVHQSAAYLWRVLSCFDGIDCRPLLDGTADQVCREIARHQLAPSAELRRFCKESSARAAACRHRADQSDCLDRFRTVDAASLDQARGCLDRRCSEIPLCFARAFGMAAPDPG